VLPEDVTLVSKRVGGTALIFLYTSYRAFGWCNRWSTLKNRKVCSKRNICLAVGGKGKDKAHPLQAMQAQRGLGELRLLAFLTSALEGGRLSASRTGRLYPRGIPGTHFHEGLSRPQSHGLVGRKYVTENSSDTTGNRSRGRPTSSAAP
jgi:hypothetical protein